jgi:hypothetical protein
MTLGQARASCSALCDLQRVLARLPLATDDTAPIARENADVRTIDTPSGADVGDNTASKANRSATSRARRRTSDVANVSGGKR